MTVTRMAPHRNGAGYTLIEVLIAGLVLSILVAGALVSLKNTVGFVTRSGRFTQTLPFALQWSERERKDVAPSYTVPTPPPDNITLMEIPGTRTMNVIVDPCNNPATSSECTTGDRSGAVKQMNRVQLKVNWNEPKN